MVARSRFEIAAIPRTTLVKVLNRFGSLAASTGLSIPRQHIESDSGDTFTIRSVFKLTDENVAADGTWAQTSCMTVTKKRYIVTRVAPDGEHRSVKSSADIIGTLANFRSDGGLDQERITDAWRNRPVLAAAGAVEPRDVDLLARAAGVQSHPSVRLEGLGACASRRRTRTGYDRSMLFSYRCRSGRLGARLVAPYEPDRSRWRNLAFHNPDGNAWSVRTPEQTGKFDDTAPTGRRSRPAFGRG
jgi:hypothetical protein